MVGDMAGPMRGVTLHVGHLKTGTTSLQAMLHESRAALAARGVIYAPSVGRYHTREAFDLLESDSVFTARRSPTLAHTMRVALAEGRGQWEGFAQAAQRSDRRTLLSAESLSFASPISVARARASLGDLPLRVVVTVRPLSELLVSHYAQWARKRVLPPVDDVMRIVLRDLLRHGDEGPFSGMLTGHLRKQWEPVADDGVATVRFDASDMPGFQRRYWAAMGIPGEAPSVVPRENESLPAGAQIAWQAHLGRRGRYDNRVDGGTLARVLGSSMMRGSGSGLRLRLRPEVAELVDASLPIEPTGHDSPETSAAALIDLLASDEPLTQFVGGGLREHEAKQRALAEAEIWEARFRRSRRIVALRIGAARRLGLRRDPSDWDRFRGEAPEAIDPLIGPTSGGQGHA